MINQLLKCTGFKSVQTELIPNQPLFFSSGQFSEKIQLWPMSYTSAVHLTSVLLQSANQACMTQYAPATFSNDMIRKKNTYIYQIMSCNL